jgi:predicted transcriptional regulator
MTSNDSNKSTLPLVLDGRHRAALKQLADEQDMSESAVMRQALRLYQMVHNRAKQGQQLAFTKNGVLVPVVVVGLSAVE